MSVFAIDLYFASRGLPPSARADAGRSSGAAGALARDGRPGAAVAVRRPVQRADVRADPAARAADAPRAHHRGQQHPQRAVHDRQRGDRRRAARRPASPSRRSSCSPASPTRWSRSTSSCWCPSTCCASSPGWLSRFVYRFKVHGRRAHPGRGRRGAGLQPRELRRRGAADGGQPAADPLRDGPPHLQACRCWAGCSGWPRRSRSRRRRKTRRPTKRPSSARRRCCATATCWRSSPKARSRATASCSRSRAAS